MWDSIRNQSCEVCEFARTEKMISCDSDDLFNAKENMQSFGSLKSDELSMYETDSTLTASSMVCLDNSPSRCPHTARPIEDDSNSQDSGYGASYQGDNGKYLPFASSRHTSLSFGSSLCSMEDEFLDFSDVEPLDKKENLPKDFNRLINDPLVHKKQDAPSSPSVTVIRPLFRRALSLQNSTTTPNKQATGISRVRTSLFRGENPEVRSFKRPEPPSRPESAAGVKRSRFFDDDDEEEASVPTVAELPRLQRAFSATEESIMCAVQRSSIEPDLIGDFSKNFCLPLTSSRHQDLKAISPATLAQLMGGAYEDKVASFKVIDCRYPYEFLGGHIAGAVNVYTKDQCMEMLNGEDIPQQNLTKRHILVFHCEFSSERGPNLYRYLRKEDRQKNESAYPSLYYPEVYLLEGGYKQFFEQFSELCVPIAYKEMLHPDHEEDLRLFRQKSKTWNCDSRQRPNRSLKRLGM